MGEGGKKGGKDDEEERDTAVLEFIRMNHTFNIPLYHLET